MRKRFQQIAKFVGFDGRRKARIHAKFPAFLSGPFGTRDVLGVNITASGAAVKSKVAMDPGTLVHLRLRNEELEGFAYVRHCSPVVNGFLLGLEFRGPLSGASLRKTWESGWNYVRVSTSGAELWDEAEA